ncbi:MAG: glycoside hydrolase, partial [Clostridiales bacterium]|nr:glycoside hydrolase [Clostridiales bacterium]
MKRIIMMITAMVLLTACSSGKETVAEPQKAQPVFSQTEKKEKTKDEIIEECLEKMTLDEKLGQMIMKEFRNDSAGEPITEINEEIKTVIQQEKIGGVVLFGENIVSAEQTKALLDALQEESEVPLFLAIDEEGGRVSRLKGSIDGYETLSAETLAEAGEEAVWEQYHKIGSTLSQLGFNLDFAPVADINTNPQNTVIGDRAFGSDPQKAGQYVTAAVKALQDENICSTLKHFPGHGDTYTDTHQEETFVNHTLDRLEEV